MLWVLTCFGQEIRKLSIKFSCTKCLTMKIDTCIKLFARQECFSAQLSTGYVHSFAVVYEPYNRANLLNLSHHNYFIHLYHIRARARVILSMHQHIMVFFVMILMVSTAIINALIYTTTSL